MKDLLNNSINVLHLSKSIENKLIENNINIVNDLWILNRNNLKNILSDKEITDVIIKLQLNGLDLNKKVYKVN